VITDRDLVLASAATYTLPVPTFFGMGGAVRIFRTMVEDVAVYAIEGTHDPLGWFFDFLALPIASHDCVEDAALGWLHGGIFTLYKSVREPLIAAISKDEKYAITGHSLGGGLTVMITGDMVARGHPPVRWAAFAPPKVGFQSLIELVAKVPGAGYRYCNDPVPEVPLTADPFWLYGQVPLRHNEGFVWPPQKAHAIENYVALEALLNPQK
jgi:hypothetical protein